MDAVVKRSGRWKKKFECKNPQAYLFILPSYSIYFAFVFLPVILTICYSFTNYDLYKKFDFIGFDNFINMFDDELFLISIKNTLVYVVFTIFPPIILGLFIAVCLNGEVIGNRFARISFYMPYITSMIAISMIWLWIYNPSYGLLNYVLKMGGFSRRQWLYDEKLAMGCIIFMTIWKTIGYCMILYLAGLQDVPRELYEASKIDGATKWQQFCQITVPLLKPVTFFIFVILTVNSFNVFDQINVMTQGGPVNSTITIVHHIYKEAFSHFRMGYASAMAVFLLMITLTFTIISFNLRGESSESDIKGR